MKKAIRFSLSLLVTIVCFWWTFKGVHWNEVKDSLKSANYFWLIPYFGILTGIHLCRVLRWGHFLSGTERVPFWKLNEASGIGFMMLIILPFRLGEFARPFLIAQRSRIRRTTAMMSVVLERIVDGMSVAVMLRVLLFFVPTENENIRYVKLGANLMFLIFGSGLIFLIFAAWKEQATMTFIRELMHVVSKNHSEKVVAVVQNFVGAIRQLPERKHLLMFFLYTALYWGLNGLGISVLSNVFDCSRATQGSCVPMHLNLFEGFVVLAVLICGLMIPAAPGSAGTFQAAIKVGLSLFFAGSVVDSSGVAFSNLLWVVQNGQQVLFGFLLLLISKQSVVDIATKLDDENSQGQPAI